VKDFIRLQFENTLETLLMMQAEEAIQAMLLKAAEVTAAALKNGGKLLIAGNGGSAADAQHLAAEFVSRLTIDRPALAVIALTTDSSILTALGNDYGYNHVFCRQIEAIARPGDIFLGISTSGRSPNILSALQECHNRQVKTIGLTGSNGGDLVALCDYPIIVPSRITHNIQEAHLVLEHVFCGLVERIYFGVERFTQSLHSYSI
jgi:D-sedoheptulose 7-phosphate isomerase